MAWMNGVKVVGATLLGVGLHPVMGFAIVGLGAAAYAPAKYGLITETVPAPDLVVANGCIEVSVVGAALLGTVLGGFLISPWLLESQAFDYIAQALWCRCCTDSACSLLWPWLRCCGAGDSADARHGHTRRVEQRIPQLSLKVLHHAAPVQWLHRAAGLRRPMRQAQPVRRRVDGRSDESRLITQGYAQPVGAGRDQLRGRGVVEGHDGDTAGHGLGDDVAKGLRHAGEEEEIGRGHMAGQIVTCALAGEVVPRAAHLQRRT